VRARIATLAVGLGLAFAVAAQAGLPASDAVQLVLLSFGVAGAGYVIGSLLLRRALHPVAVALTPVVAMVLGVVAAARAMFVSTHDLSALGVVLVGAGTAGVLAALQLARELSAARSAAAEAAARERSMEGSRRELVAWVSHDLRTPLAGIQAMVEALEDGVVTDPAEVSDYHRRLTGQVTRLGQLVDDLFELSRIESAALDLQLERTPLDEVISEAVASTAIVARAKGVRLGGDLGTTEVTGSPQELTRVVANLLDNAIRHTPRGGAVTVEVQEREHHVDLSVADTCGGIPEQELDRVFDLAYRGDAARTPGAGGGAGLGLAIARGLVEAHQGDIAVRNDGPGCRFTVRLPLAR
jgi:signal transduction histidine kinase